MSVRTIVAASLSASLVACGTTTPRASVRSEPVRESSSARTVALVDNTPIHAEDLSATLFELAGRVALREQVLDILLKRELASSGRLVSSEMVARERTLFEQRLSSDDKPGRSRLLADEVFRSRGLGPVRRRAMFWRNAALRQLAGDTVEVREDDVDAAVELAYGPKVIARVIVTENERDAAEVLRLLGPSPSPSVFARIAEQYSIDPTSSRGGLLQPIHLADTNYPVAVREALGILASGSMSAVIPIEDGSAVFLKEGSVPASTPPEGARSRLRGELELQLERSAMDALARRLVSQARVDVLDRSLGWAWDDR